MSANSSSMNVRLTFNADTTRVKSELQSLKAQINSLMTTPSNSAADFGIGSAFKEANKDLALLKAQLQTSTTSTGLLDLTKFNDSLKKSGKTIGDYKDSLMALGPEGREAFSALTQSILEAEVPLKRTNGLLDGLWDNLKKTAGWQLSSTMVHKFVGSVQTAYYYAQDLNKSLNDIRIVSGQSADQMAKFAKEANASAQALNTTTTAYTDAALIFYQQGLDNEAVKQRTDAVIKMANVTGETAADVSSYMTAIWNNFNDGSKSVEYFADVLTALGAATASSTDEIAEGLEKFASIGNTVGLSYEYASSALATVVAETRQSADTVGTAFKTLFARIQDLELGKTLDDGTTLGQYSEALASIGVNIKDANGQVKDMDDILDEMGSKWKTISKDTQIAVAQAVAGTRQYTQLVALMDKYDTFKENVGIAENSEGELQKQADIYAESWAAAKKRVQASMEELYSQILDDKFFIKLTNWVADLIKSISKLIDSFGGVGNILVTIGAISTRIFQKQMVNSIDGTIYKIKSAFGITKKEALDVQKEALKAHNEMSIDAPNSKSPIVSSEYTYSRIAKMQDAILKNSSKWTDQEKLLANIFLQQQKTLAEEVKEKEKLAESQSKESLNNVLKQNDQENKVFKEQQARYEEYLAKKEEIDNINGLKRNKKDKKIKDLDFNYKDVKDFDESKKPASKEDVKQYYDKKINSEAFTETMKTFFDNDNDVTEKNLEEMKKKSLNIIDEIVKGLDAEGKSLEDVEVQLDEAFGEGATRILVKFKKKLDDNTLSIEDMKQAMQDAVGESEKLGTDIEEEYRGKGINIESLQPEITKASETRAGAIVSNVKSGLHSTKTTDQMNDFSAPTERTQQFIELANAITSTVMSINAMSGAFSTWGDVASGNASVGDALLQTFTALSMIIPTLVTLTKKDTITTVADTVAKGAKLVVTKLLKKEVNELAIAEKLASVSTGVLVAAMAVVIGTVALVKAGIDASNQSLQDEADSYGKAAKAQEEHVDALKEEASELGTLVDSYEKLKTQLEENQITAKEFGNQSYQLCLQYGQEEAAVYALTGQYDKLEESIKKAQVAKEEEVQSEARQANKTYKNQLTSQLRASAKGRIDDDAIDLRGMVDRTSKENSFASELKALGVDFTNKDHISLESYTEAISKDSDAVYAVLTEYSANGVKSAKQLLGYWDDIQDAVDGINSTTDTINESLKNSALAKIDTSSIDSYQSYSDAVNKAAEEIKSAFNGSVEEAKNWLNTELSSNEDVAQYGSAGVISESIIKSLYGDKDSRKEYLEEKKKEAFSDYEEELVKNFLNGQDQATLTGLESLNIDVSQIKTISQLDDANLTGTGDIKNKLNKYKESFKDSDILPSDDEIDKRLNEISEKISKYSLGQQSFFSEHSNLLAVNDFDVDKVASKYSEAMNYVGKQAGSAYAKSLAETITKDKRTLTSKEVDSYMDDYYIPDMVGQERITKESFAGMDYASQTLAMATYYSEQQQWLKDNKDKALEAYEAEKKAFEEKNKAELKSYEDAKAGLEQTAQKTADEGDFAVTTEELEKLSEAYVQVKGNIDSLDDDSKNTLTTVQNTLSESEMDDFFDNLKDFGKNKSIKDNLESINAEIANFSDGVQSAEKESELWNTAFDATNQVIDNTQAAYSTLSSAMKSYNSTGYFTMDNLQSILDLSPQYIQCLEQEDGQFKLNAQSMMDLTYAQLQNMAVEQAEMALSNVKAYMQDSNNEKIKAQVEVTNNLTTATWDLASAEMGEARAAAAAEKDATKRATLENYLNGVQTKIDAIKNVANNLNLSTFDNIMGSGSSSSKKSKKYFEDEFDRYWEFNKLIDEVAHSMERLEDQQDKLYGQELIDNLNQVNGLLVQQKANYEALYEAQKVEAEELRSSLSAYGALFDEEGRLTNYADITTSMFAKYGNVEDSETYTEFKKYLERYDTLYYSEMVDTTDKIVEESKKILENNLKIWETDIQINLDLKQAERDWNDFLKEINKNFKSTLNDTTGDLAYALKKAQTYNLNDGTLATDIQKIQNINFEIDKLKNGGSSSMFSSLSEAEKALEEANKTLRTDAEEFYQTYQDAYDSVLSGYDDIIDGLDKINEQYKDLDDELEHQKNLVDLLYGDKAYDKLGKIYETQKKNGLAQLENLKLQSKFYDEQYKKAVELDGADSKSAEKWLAKKREAMKDLRSEEETYIKTIQDSYNNTIDSIIEKARQAANGGVDTDWARTVYDLTKTKSEGNYDDVERVYQLTSLQSKWNKLIADTTGTKNQEKLKKIMDAQLENLEKKTTLTEYDIGLAEKELAVEQARIALDEARNAKNSMKLTRNAEGNWSYQYVADEDNIAEKQQDLLDAINDKYEYVKEANQKALDDLLQYEEDFWTKYAEIMKDVSLSDEERHARVNELYQLYYGEEGILTQAYQDSAQTQQDLNLVTAEQLWAIYDSDQEKYATMTAAEQELIDGLKNGTIQSYEDIQAAGEKINDESLDYWNTTAQAMADAWNADDGESIKSQVNEALNDCSEALDDYVADIDAGCEAAGEDFTDVEGAVDDISDAIDDLDGVTEDYIENAEDLIDDYIESLKDLESQWEAVKKIVEKNIETMKEYKQASDAATASANQAQAAQSSGGGDSGGVGDTTPNKTKDEEETVHYYSVDSAPDGDGLVVTVYERTGNNEKAIGRDGEEPKDYKDHRISSVWEARDYINQVLSDNGYDEELDPDVNVQTSGYKYYLDNARVNTYSFDTGGYTGEWDSSGRLAILHEKELVLNKEDTENILNTVEFVRDLASSIGTSLLAQLAGLASSTAGLHAANMDYSLGNTNNTSNNNVYNVTAEFPNAENVQDIREALLSLPNLISQKVNEKNI